MRYRLARGVIEVEGGQIPEHLVSRDDRSRAEPVERHRLLYPERPDRLSPQADQVRADPEAPSQIARNGADVGAGAYLGPERQIRWIVIDQLDPMHGYAHVG
jgi:hypothetical protein